MIGSTWEQNLGKLLDQLDPDPKKLARKPEEKHEITRKESLVVFNQTCLNSNLLEKYAPLTHTHTHTHDDNYIFTDDSHFYYLNYNSNTLINN